MGQGATLPSPPSAQFTKLRCGRHCQCSVHLFDNISLHGILKFT